MRKNVYKGRIKKKFGKFFHTHLLEVLGHGGGSVRGCSGSRVLTSMLAAPLYNVPTTTNNPNTCCPTFGHSDPARWRKRSGIE